MLKWLAGVIAAVLVVASCTSTGDAPPVTPETRGALSSIAIGIACDQCVLREVVYVHDRVFTWDSEIGDEQAMPDETRAAITAQFPNATFVSRSDVDALFVDHVVVGDGVLVSVGPVEELAQDVVGVQVGVLFARYDGFADMIQFRWDGDGWEPATSEETGVTVTTSVT